MNKYLKIDPWCIIEDKFDPRNQESSESIFSIGNGHFGLRANFEEQYSGESLQGTYIAGVYYPDKTKVGWWKIGYPEYFAKVLNAPNFIGINIRIEHEVLDLAKLRVHEFRRILNMKNGSLNRQFIAEFESGKKIQVETTRFLSMANPEIGAIHYSITPLNFSGNIEFVPYLDGNVTNRDANWDETFWQPISESCYENEAYITCHTKKTEFDVCTGMMIATYLGHKKIKLNAEPTTNSSYTALKYNLKVEKNKVLSIKKYISVLSSFNHEKNDLQDHSMNILRNAFHDGYENLFRNHTKKWEEIWEHSDIRVEGDDEAQQGIRFNIFQLNQTYTGDDERLNVGPKGFTGEKYGGSTYWDTEAYCLPFFLCTAPQKVSRNLLLYRYKHLEKAIENAEKLGFTNGAALYPMVTINGEECHNEWEITFEEIHRNGAISFAIYNYLRHTGDTQYLVDYGLEVLIGISRFWGQRITYSHERNKYVMLGVTGPNEYENNVNNNWYTNTIAVWTLNYTLEVLNLVKELDHDQYYHLLSKLNFNYEKETTHWKDIIANMHFPYLKEQDVFLQQDGYMDKEQVTVGQLNPTQRPINQHWSWDRILRSCFIKQADVLQGIYLFEEKYDIGTIRRNFEFYESRTVHESSLSSCVHVVLAARINDIKKAYELYLRTSRLDLDDYNNEVNEGLHITSMAGTWMSVVEGFGGKRVRDDHLVLNPRIPEHWKSYSFKILFRGALLKIDVTNSRIVITNESDVNTELIVYENKISLAGYEKHELST